MRAARWRNLRDDLRQADAELAAARAAGAAARVSARAACAARRAAASSWCKSERERVRAAAADEIGRAAEWKRSAWEHYRWLREQPPPRSWEREYSAAEHDQLTAQNIPPQFHELWDELRARFPRTTTPDNRAEIFLEWLEEHRAEVLGHFADRADAIDWSAAEEAAADTSFDPAEWEAA